MTDIELVFTLSSFLPALDRMEKEVEQDEHKNR